MTIHDPKIPSRTGGSGANIVGGGVGAGPGPEVMAASTLDGNKVVSSGGAEIGKISDIMPHRQAQYIGALPRSRRKL
ncbi:hypothetical protein OKW43_006075 [Paraburkholderia sp. WC7.3g]